MAYKLINGTFHIFYPDIPRNGPEPDGDTLKFLPDNPAFVEMLHQPGSPGPDFNGRGMINIRFEGIDALETHFRRAHQNVQWAEAARDSMLDETGFGNVTFWSDLPNKVKSVENHPIEGYILARTLDGHGRIVAFVYAGETNLVDGSDVWVDTQMLDDSVNAQLIKSGLVYPAFYTTLPIDLKDHLAQLLVQARTDDQGLWPSATATVDKAATAAGLAQVQELVIWPKLFRRLVSYFGAGHTGLAGFDAWLRADPKDRDDRVILPNGELGNMHDLLAITNNRIRMQHRPEEIIIVPDDELVSGTAPVVVPDPVAAAPVRIVAALVNPAGPEAGNERVTLLNATPAAVDLDGWALADKQNNRHPLAGTIDSGAALQVALDANVRLGNRGDNITLFNVADEIVDQVSYSEKQARREGWTIVF